MPKPQRPTVTQATRVPTAKVVAATGGAAIGQAIAVLVRGYAMRHGWDLTDAEAIALEVLIVATCTFVAGYFKRAHARDMF